MYDCFIVHRYQNVSFVRKVYRCENADVIVNEKINPNMSRNFIFKIYSFFISNKLNGILKLVLIWFKLNCIKLRKNKIDEKIPEDIIMS